MHPETSPSLDRGSVVVEAALVIPVLLAVTVLFVWVTSLGATYVRLLDVAQTAARQAARGAVSIEPRADIELSLTERDGLIRAQASQRIAPPLAGFIDWGVTITAEAHAVPEWMTVDAGGVDAEMADP
jgi:Flp pilus assembly protein TadG